MMSFLLLILIWSWGINCTEFVRRSGIHFQLEGKRFYFAGANAYNLFTRDHERIDKRMDEMQKNGVKVVRTNAFNHEEKHGFEPKKGVYVEAQFQVLDYILDSARRHGIYLILTLENYWKDYGGIDSRLRWEGLPGETHAHRAKFYTNDGCKQSYKNYLTHILTRTNTVNKIAYNQDPYIFSWELMNEPRFQDAGEDKTGKTFRKWVDEMAGHVKSLDPNHMVSTGLEGHGTKYGYGGDEGNPFVYIHQSPYIDFSTGHLYPDGWVKKTPAEAAKIVIDWIQDSHRICNKPFVLEEYNSHKNQPVYWAALHNAVENLDGAGTTFWNFLAYDERYSDFDVWDGHEILKVFNNHAQKMNNKH